MNNRIRRVAMAAVVAALFGTPALASGDDRSSNEMATFARGAKLYNDNCGRCHNPRSPSEYSDREWPLIVTHMRVIGGLPGDQARAIEEFLRASNNPPTPRAADSRKAEDGTDRESRTVEADMSEAALLDGMELMQRYGCKGCHVVGGQGGEIGPNLDTVFERREETYVLEHIRHPKTHNPSSVMPELGLSARELEAILSVLRAAH